MNQRNSVENYFVLSTGRTATTSLTRLIQNQNCSGQIDCFQEPFPGWFFQLMSNRASAGRFNPYLDRCTRSVFLFFRHRREKKFPSSKRLEINPFLYGLAPLVEECLGPYHLIHMIRHPLGYIRSALSFRPGGFKDRWIHGNLWNPDIHAFASVSRREWSKLPLSLKKAWLWVFINKTIASYAPQAKTYEIFRYEDIFNSSQELRKKTLHRLFSLLGLDSNLPELEMPRLNAVPEDAQVKIPAQEIEQVLKICAPLRQQFGYDPSPDGLLADVLQDSLQASKNQAGNVKKF